MKIEEGDIWRTKYDLLLQVIGPVKPSTDGIERLFGDVSVPTKSLLLVLKVFPKKNADEECGPFLAMWNDTKVLYNPYLYDKKYIPDGWKPSDDLEKVC
jgi:hypothetical protein